MSDLLLNIVSVPIPKTIKRDTAPSRVLSRGGRRRRTQVTNTSSSHDNTTSITQSPHTDGKRKKISNKNQTDNYGRNNKNKTMKGKARKRRRVEKSDMKPWLDVITASKDSKHITLSTIFDDTPSSWEDMNLNRLVQSALKGMGMEKPTKVQQVGIPLVMEGHDVMIKAETGSGKTLAYCVPIIHHMASLPHTISRKDGPYAIILAPTRELSLQIYGVVQGLVKSCNYIVPGIVVGGEKRKSEKARLRKGVNILIATPGRLLDHLNHTSSFSTHNLQWMVLDEADRLLDMGFEKDIKTIFQLIDRRHRKIVSKECNKESSTTTTTTTTTITNNSTKITDGDKGKVWRRTILTSATLREGLERLAHLSLQQPLFVEPPKMEGDTATPKQLVQKYMVVPCKKRLLVLAALLYAQVNVHRLRYEKKEEEEEKEEEEHKGPKIIVFFSTIKSVEFTCDLLANADNTAFLEGSQQIKRHHSTHKKRSKQPSVEEDIVVPFLECPLFKLHGNLPQVDRTHAFNEFCAAKRGILFCTDVAARGLDLPEVDWIVQYDPPGEPAEYIHRVGRTARAGAEGNAILFLLPEEIEYVELLSRQYKVRLEEVKSSSVVAVLDAQLPSKHSIHVEEGVAVQLYFENLVSSGKDDGLGEEFLKPKAVAAFQSFVRAYTTHSRETKHIFHVKNLHLGHVAKSFALRDPPSKLGRQLSRAQPTPQRTSKKSGKRKKDVFSKLRMGDEFASGL